MLIRERQEGVNEESVLDQKQVIEVVHVARSEQASVSITISSCRESSTKHKGRRQITISQFRKTTDKPI